MYKGILAISLMLFVHLSRAEPVLDRDYCRNHANETEMVECVKREIYDPCEDASGSRGWWSAQCAWSHSTIAEQKISAAEESLIAILKSDGGKDSALYERFLDSQKKWASFKESYCNFTNAADDSKYFEGSYLHYGYCLKRINEQRAEELEAVLQQTEEGSME